MQHWEMFFGEVMLNEGQVSHVVRCWRKKFDERILLVRHCFYSTLKRVMSKFHLGAFRRCTMASVGEAKLRRGMDTSLGFTVSDANEIIWQRMSFATRKASKSIQ
jgi:hypothetical protein